VTTEAELELDVGPTQDSVWKRGLFMLLFVVIYGVAEAVVLAVAVIQFGWLVVAEERNERLQRFGASLSAFIFEVVKFWTFVSDEKPFPFAEWPESRSGSDPR
jgi:hypothetical protein